jgi:hypothetical protein
MAQGLNRNGYQLRPVLKAKPQVPEPEALLAHLRERDTLARDEGSTQRLSIDGKATVSLGEYSRGGQDSRRRSGV